MGVEVVFCKSGWFVLRGRGGRSWGWWPWGWWPTSGAIGLWGHRLVLVRVALVAFIIFIHVDVEGAGDAGSCCIGR
jgi:hypothetical protein